jgi:hypothetical protein
MSESKSGNVSPIASETAGNEVEKVPNVLETVKSAPEYRKYGWWDGIKSVFLAKASTADAPLEYGGHRVAEEPTKRGLSGVLSKYARFFGPGMIITVAYIDPDNFQTSVEDGQDFGYKMLFMVLISLLIAIYLQVSVFALILFCMIVTNKRFCSISA